MFWKFSNVSNLILTFICISRFFQRTLRVLQLLVGTFYSSFNSSNIQGYLTHFLAPASKFFLKKISYIFTKKPCSEEVSYIFSKIAFLIFRKVIFLIFRERYFQNPGITELSYILEKIYSEPQHNGTFLYFRKDIFRTLA